MTSPTTDAVRAPAAPVRAAPAVTGAAERDRTWTIAQVAEEFGVTHRTVRHYEELGLITPERRGTTRVYHRRDRTRLGLILRGKRLGFPLEEIRTIIDLYDVPRGRRSQLEYVLAQIDERRDRPRAAPARPRRGAVRAHRVRAPLPRRPRPPGLSTAEATAQRADAGTASGIRRAATAAVRGPGMRQGRHTASGCRPCLVLVAAPRG